MVLYDLNPQRYAKKSGEEVVVSSGHLVSLPSHNDDKDSLVCCGHAEISDCFFVAYTCNLLCLKTKTTKYVTQKQAHGPSGTHTVVLSQNAACVGWLSRLRGHILGGFAYLLL
jgi:hypothetical protein